MATVKLMSSDGQEFEVDKQVIQMSVTVKNMLEGMPFLTHRVRFNLRF